MFNFFKKFLKKDSNSLSDSISSINLPSHVFIESIVSSPQNGGGGKKYYDNIYTRNVSKL